MLRKPIVAMLFLVLVGLSGLAIFDSSAYQKCSAGAGGESSTEHQGQEEVVSLVRPTRIVFSCTGQSIAENNAVVSAVATIVIAVFTTILGLFTMSLARSTRISADAAMLSAQAAIGVELPHLIVSKIEFQDVEAPDIAVPRKVIVTVTNYGRTPAFVSRETTEMRIIQRLPLIPDYCNAVDLEPGHVIEARTTHDLTARLQDLRSIIDCQPLQERKDKMWVYGCIMYRDFLDKPHTLRFCAGLYFPIGLAENLPPRFIQCGCPDEYIKSSY
jgi:hypothetical protein